MSVLLRRVVVLAFLIFFVVDALPTVLEDTVPARLGRSAIDTVVDDWVDDILVAGHCTPSLASPALGVICRAVQQVSVSFAVSLAEEPRAPPLA